MGKNILLEKTYFIFHCFTASQRTEHWTALYNLYDYFSLISWLLLQMGDIFRGLRFIKTNLRLFFYRHTDYTWLITANSTIYTIRMMIRKRRWITIKTYFAEALRRRALQVLKRKFYIYLKHSFDSKYIGQHLPQKFHQHLLLLWSQFQCPWRRKAKKAGWSLNTTGGQSMNGSNLYPRWTYTSNHLLEWEATCWILPSLTATWKSG